MAVTPFPVSLLIAIFLLSELDILAVMLLQVNAIGLVLVVVPMMLVIVFGIMVRPCIVLMLLRPKYRNGRCGK